jgi:hypothetical protein
MFVKRITVENVGPLEQFDIELPFHPNDNPEPVILVGENGTGKSILLSIVVNSLIAAKQQCFDDSEVTADRVYKLRSPLYITNNKHHYYTRLLFENDYECTEWQLRTIKKEFVERFGYTPTGVKWEVLGETESSIFWSNFPDKRTELKDLISRRCLLYFPANRFEEPAWLNLSHLTSQAEYTDLERLTNISNRRIIHYAPLKANQNWLMDILFDRNVLESRVLSMPIKTDGGQVTNLPVFGGYVGNCAMIYNSILQVLKVILRSDDNIRFGVGDRSQRNISIMRNEQTWIPNLFQLSSGEALVFDLFLTIIRDYDLTRTACTSLNEISGLVLIDEIDLHLHSAFQYEVLPNLIKLFPQIQFIITSHSPLFLLGMQRALTNDGFAILEMPSGKEISAEEFAEFGSAYSRFRVTRTHDEAIRLAVAESQKPILFVEGDYDIRYLRKAAQLLGKTDLLESFSLVDGGGFGNLDNVWKHFNSRVAEILSQAVILLYDCDTGKQDGSKDRVVRRVMETRTDTPIGKGIENLFPGTTIDRAADHKRAFIDITPETQKLFRGEKVLLPEVKEVNKDEKGNLCDWLCETGTVEDFVNFEQVLRTLEELLNPATG